MPMNLHLSIPAFHQSGRQAFHSLLRKKAIGSAYPLSQGGPEGRHHLFHHFPPPIALATLGSSEITRKLANEVTKDVTLKNKTLNTPDQYNSWALMIMDSTWFISNK